MVTKVLVLEAAPSMGGSFTSIQVVIKKGMEEGLSFGMLAPKLFEKILPSQVKFHHLPAKKESHVRNLFEQFVLIRQIIQEWNYDLLILNNLLTENIAGVWAAKSLNIPVIQFIRAFEDDSKTWKACNQQVDAYIAVSNSIQEHLLKIGAPAEKIHLALEGIQVGPYKSVADQERLRSVLGISPSAIVIGFVGRLVRWKGVSVFVKAATQLMKVDERIHAVIIGAEDESNQAELFEIKERIQRKKMEDRFHFMGHIPAKHTIELMRGLDLFFHTSIEPEPFGRVLIEAMAAGIPTLSSSGGGPREIIQHQKNGILTPTLNNSKELAEGALWLLESNERLQEIGVEARKTVIRSFNESICAQPVLDLIYQLV